MAEYRIRWVPEELMGGRGFVLCNKHGDGVVLCLNRRIRRLPDEENAAALEGAWRAFNAMAEDEIPAQRRAYAHSG